MTSDTELFSIAGIKRAELIYRLRGLHPESDERFHWNPIGDANLFAEIYKGLILYVVDQKMWYIYNGVRWIPGVGGVEIDKALKTLAEELHRYAVQLGSPVLQQGYAKHANRWTQRKTRDTIERDARSVHPVKAADFDRDPWALNINNGVIDLRTGRARSRKPGDMLSKLAPVTFAPKAKCEP